jgi:hypothetical protein
MPPSTSRREFLLAGGAANALLTGIPSVGVAAPAELPAQIPALLPRDAAGHHFVFYADCCSGVPGAPNENSHAEVNRVVERIRPLPEFIAFPGDAVMGYVEDKHVLRTQWDHWWNTEMAWLQKLGLPLYQSTSNHNTYDLSSEEIFREFHPYLPQNGSAAFRGLEYFVRRGDLLYVSTHQPDRTRPYRHDMLIDPGWLDRVLTENADAKHKFVCGHYPVFPVNGYFYYPQWSFRPQERKPFWDVLVKHRTTAYLCSHILAFDVQIHEGIPQILSGGAGTKGTGPLALMPLRSEYLHAVQMAIDNQGLRCRTLDTAGNAREEFAWPLDLRPSTTWKPLDTENLKTQLATVNLQGSVVTWRIQGQTGSVATASEPQTWLWGYDPMEGTATIWIGLEGTPSRLTVRLIPQSGFGWQTWTGPVIDPSHHFDWQLALHPGLGPGGVLIRSRDDTAWQSLMTTSSKGVEELKWPQSWWLGHGPSGIHDWPFTGSNLHVAWQQTSLPEVGAPLL